MNLKLTNQQKQYLMYFSIFVLGYLMCMYYPVHNKNNNVPMPILEGFDPDEYDINDIYSIGVNYDNGGSLSVTPASCMMDFAELNNGVSCNKIIRQNIDQYPDNDIYIRTSPDTREEDISLSRDELLNFLESEKVCSHRYEVPGLPDGLSLCAEKGNEEDHPCGDKFDENCERNNTPTNSGGNNTTSGSNNTTSGSNNTTSGGNRRGERRR